MTYQDFVSNTLSSIELKLPADVKVHLKKIPFNNQVMRDGVSFCSPENSVSPLIYLDSLYNSYSQSGVSLDTITDSIIDSYKAALPTDSPIDDTITDFDKIKNSIVYRLVNMERNAEMLKNTPFIPYLDLAVIFAVMVSIKDKNDGSIRIDNNLRECWGIDVSLLFETASKNSSRLLPSQFMSMEDLLADCMNVTPEFSEPCNPDPGNLILPLYVLTNSDRMHGAAAILYEGCLHKIAEDFHENLYIIPSSIHEVLILPESSAPDEEYINEMITSTNDGFVTPSEYLSDHFYYYNRHTGEITY